MPETNGNQRGALRGYSRQCHRPLRDVSLEKDSQVTQTLRSLPCCEHEAAAAALLIFQADRPLLDPQPRSPHQIHNLRDGCGYRHANVGANEAGAIAEQPVLWAELHIPGIHEGTELPQRHVLPLLIVGGRHPDDVLLPISKHIAPVSRRAREWPKQGEERK